MKITEKAEKKLKPVFKKAENAGKSLRLYIAGFGWGGPQLGLALEEQKKDDHMRTVNGFKVIFDNTVSHIADSVIIDYRKTFFDEGFVAETAYSCW